MWTRLAVAVVTMICVGPVGAQSSGRPAGLSALDFLVGSCWAGQGPRGETDRHCFTAMLDDHFIRDVHSTTGLPKPYSGETVYHWDAKQAVVRYTYWNSDGGVSTGTMRVEDGRLLFPEIHEGKDGRRSEYRSVWFRDGADAYVAKTELKKPEGWVEQFRIVYERVAEKSSRMER